MPIEVLRCDRVPERDFWEELLQGWGRLMDRYCDLFPDDASYWYGERALTGILAAVAWKVENGWSLEEFAAPRLWGEEASSGRGDAWIGRGRTWFTVEAKCAWVSTTAVDVAIRGVRQGIDEAKVQLATLNKEYLGAAQFAACYLVPELTSVEAERAGSLFEALAGHFREQLVAVYRPIDKLRSYQRRSYPGVALIAERFIPPL